MLTETEFKTVFDLIPNGNHFTDSMLKICKCDERGSPKLKLYTISYIIKPLLLDEHKELFEHLGKTYIDLLILLKSRDFNTKKTLEKSEDVYPLYVKYIDHYNKIIECLLVIVKERLINKEEELVLKIIKEITDHENISEIFRELLYFFQSNVEIEKLVETKIDDNTFETNDFDDLSAYEIIMCHSIFRTPKVKGLFHKWLEL